MDASDITRQKNEFAEKNCVVRLQLFENTPVKSLLSHIEKARFYPQNYVSFNNLEFAGHLTIKENQPALHQIQLLLNNPPGRKRRKSEC